MNDKTFSIFGGAFLIARSMYPAVPGLIAPSIFIEMTFCAVAGKIVIKNTARYENNRFIELCSDET